MWNVGHELYRSTPETFPVPFVQGDILDPAYLAPAPILPTSSTPPSSPAPVLSKVKTLNELHGKISAIWASAFFHFNFDDQVLVARKLAGLLSPLPGSIIFGSHTGMDEKQQWDVAESKTDYHSPETFKELWEGLFAEASVQVDVQTRPRKKEYGLNANGLYPENTQERFHLDWSVTRV